VYCISVRSYSVAAFIVGRGIDPVDAVLIDGRTVFRFPPSADPAMTEYQNAKLKLDTLAQTAQPGTPGGEVIR